MKRLLVMTIAILLIAAPVMAAVDFEAPAYTVGGLSGQNGWVPTQPAAWWVENTHVLAGAQSLKVTAADDNFYPLPASTSIADGTILGMRTESIAAESGWMFWNMMVASAPGVYADTYCGIFMDGVNVMVSDNTTAVYGWHDTGYDRVVGHVYDLTMTLDFTNQKYTVGVNDLTNPSSSFSVADIAFQVAATPASASAGQVYMGGTWTYFDNMSINTVPEPSALLALATGLMGICGFSVRRKK